MDFFFIGKQATCTVGIDSHEWADSLGSGYEKYHVGAENVEIFECLVWL